MSSTLSQLNRKIPFDVLGLIFSHYGAEETIHYPLETLLLVCQGWKEAALGHRTLWNELNIYIGHKLTSEIWNARLPLRLARSGLATPLYIRLRNYLTIPLYQRTQNDVHNDKIYSLESCEPMYYSFAEAKWLGCDCSTAAMRCIEASLRMLTGENGELCHRWHSFELCLGLLGANPEDGRATRNLQAFNQATNLRELSLFLIYPVEINLPLRFDNLTHLHLKGRFSIDLLGPRTCEIPSLADLTIEFLQFDVPDLVPRKPFHRRLHKLTISCDAPSFVAQREALEWLLKLLSLCPHIDTLCINEDFLFTLLAEPGNLPIDSFLSLMRGKSLVNTGNGSSCWISDSEGPQSLERIMSMLGISDYF